MNPLSITARRLVSSGRGILAADESPRTMSARLSAEGVAPTEENRLAYREMLVTAPDLDDCVSGVILSDETFHQVLSTGQGFPETCLERGILPGVKVDSGTVPLAGAGDALVTEGLEGLPARLAVYAELGAAFAKWRAVIDIANASPYSIGENARVLAQYARMCQEHEIVPIVEPEVLWSGRHSIEDCAVTTERVLGAVFEHLDRAGVALSGIILKPNMVTPGQQAKPVHADLVAAVTLGVLGSFVPAAVPGIAFLSGGYANSTACEFLAEINALAMSAPWELTYSFGRALVSDALRDWAEEPEDPKRAHDTLLANCRRAALATTRRPTKVA